MQQSYSESEIDEVYADDKDLALQHRKNIDSRRKLEEYLEEKQLKEFLEDDYDTYIDED